VIAAGTKNGLILLIALDKMEITARLRGHDMEVTSLDWMYLSMTPKVGNVSLENLIASTDTSDCFDIYTDNTEPEFGDFRGETKEVEVKGREMVNNSNFNFLEACSELKNEILAEDGGNDNCPQEKFEDNAARFNIQTPKTPSESLESNASSDSLKLEAKDFVVVSKKDVDLEVPVLASGSQEQLAWLWDVEQRAQFCKIKWHPKNRPALPSPFTNVLWMNQETLLVTDGNGDINEFEISLDVNARKLTSKAKERKFDARGVLNLCRSKDGAVLWTSSIHRHISCLEVAKNFEKVISLDTMQLRVHFVVENPIDSNVIAIGGNDKRICLWNTSLSNATSISLRPFMNKIHTGILSLSWHPDKDNILAFSTREGRIGVLDVNKSSNVPTVLESFSSQEVYSIAWAKVQDSTVLIACNGQKFVCYAQKDWKMRAVEHLKGAASLAVNGDLLAVGLTSGELQLVDISSDFRVVSSKKVSGKYVGMMSWHDDTLAIATDTGIFLAKIVDHEIPENLQKLEGHRGRVFSVRFNKAGDFLVSCCVGGFVKVWDLEAMTAVGSFNLKTLAYSAIFLPGNEDFVVCGGQDSTVVTFEWKKHQDISEVTKKKPQKGKNVQWAAPTEVTKISKNNQKRQKQKIAKVVDDSVAELTGEVAKMSMNSVRFEMNFEGFRRILGNFGEFYWISSTSRRNPRRCLPQQVAS
jgi:WD40 repeat protein